MVVMVPPSVRALTSLLQVVEGGQAVLFSRVRGHAEGQQPPDLVNVISGRSLEQHHGGLEVDPCGVLLVHVEAGLLPLQVVLPLSLRPSLQLEAPAFPKQTKVAQ